MTVNEVKHHGVLGMHWGVRKRETPAEEARKLIKKTNRMNGNSLFGGYGLRGYYMQKKYDRIMKKNPNFMFKKLSKEDQRKYLDQGTHEAQTRLLIRGLGEVAGGAVVGKFVGMYLFGLNEKYSLEAAIGISSLIALTRMSEIHSMGVANKHEHMMERFRELENDPEAKKVIENWRG